jgi:hypothetical protein
MAGAVDRTFVQAMAVEAERRQGRTHITTAYPLVTTADGTQISIDPRTGAPVAQAAEGAAPRAQTFAPSTSAFGVEKRPPRGSYLWPSATTAALGLSALAPDGEQSMSVAALELLAAHAVAELGTYTALGPSDVERQALGGVASRAADGAAVTTGAAEPTDDDVLASAASFVPAARRDKFQALYLALSQSPSGRTALARTRGSRRRDDHGARASERCVGRAPRGARPARRRARALDGRASGSHATPSRRASRSRSDVHRWTSRSRSALYSCWRGARFVRGSCGCNRTELGAP